MVRPVRTRRHARPRGRGPQHRAQPGARPSGSTPDHHSRASTSPPVLPTSSASSSSRRSPSGRRSSAGPACPATGRTAASPAFEQSGAARLVSEPRRRAGRLGPCPPPRRWPCRCALPPTRSARARCAGGGCAPCCPAGARRPAGGRDARLAGDAPGWLVATTVATAVAAVTYGMFVPPLLFRIHRWEITDEAVYTLSGWLVREWRIAPISRVQTVDTEHGPLQQLLELATVTVTTASARGPVKIPGLDARRGRRAGPHAHRDHPGHPRGRHVSTRTGPRRQRRTAVAAAGPADARGDPLRSWSGSCRWWWCCCSPGRATWSGGCGCRSASPRCSSLGGVVRWRTTRYRITGERVELHTGWLRRQRRSVPRDRIRTVDLTARLVHRVFGLSVVQVSAASRLAAGELRAEPRRRQQGRGRPAASRAAGPPRGGRARRRSGAAVPPVEELARLRLVLAALRAADVLLARRGRRGRRAPCSTCSTTSASTRATSTGRRRRDRPPGHRADLAGGRRCRAASARGRGRRRAAAVRRALVRLPAHPRAPGRAPLRVKRGLLTRRSLSVSEQRLRGAEVVEPLLLRAGRGAQTRALSTGLAGERARAARCSRPPRGRRPTGWPRLALREHPELDHRWRRCAGIPERRCAGG